jgi:hypothetical protein
MVSRETAQFVSTLCLVLYPSRASETQASEVREPYRETVCDL